MYWLKVSKLERQIGGFLLEMLLAKVHLGDAGSLSVGGKRLYVYVQCPVFLTNLEGKVGKVGKVGRVGKVGKVGMKGRLRE